MPIAFDRTTCCDLQETISREWLITNGLGGYAAGTVTGTLTRMQHGLLVASLPTEQAQQTPPSHISHTTQLLLAKLDEEIVFDQRTYFLGTNEYKDGTLNPAGFVHLENFQLEEGFPIFTYHLGGIDGIMLEKRIWMPQGLNTTYIHYRVVRTASPERNDWQNALPETTLRTARLLEDAHAAQRTISLTLLPFASYRLANEPLHGKLNWQFDVKPQFIDADFNAQEEAQSIAGCTIRASSKARPYHIFAVGHRDSQVSFLPTGVWYWNFLHREDQATDDFYLPGVFRAKLWPDVELTIIVTAEDLSWQTFNIRQLKRAYTEAIEVQRDIVQAERYFGDGGVTTHMHPVLPLSSEEPVDTLSAEEFLRALLQAGNRFLAHRALPLDESGGQPSLIFSSAQTVPIILSGFFDAQERTRDSLIGLPGMTLTTRHYAVARRILLTLGRYFKDGLLPDRLPTPDRPLSEADYSSVDTSLWYFYALDAYLRTTHDDNVLEDLFPSLQACIASLVNGTRSGIGVDPHDGLLRAFQPGKALTWMNAYGGANVPLTPRSGKPVEVNALWYFALTFMKEWSEHLYQGGCISHVDSIYDELRKQCKRSFNERFWYEEGGYLYDVIDGPQGDDASLRPNQLFAFSLNYPVLVSSRRQAVLNVVAQRLLTHCGLRSLAPQCDGYVGHILGRASAPEARAAGAYNGGAWPWLMGAYLDALFQVEGMNDRLKGGPGSHLDNLAHKYALWRTGIELLEPYRKQLSHNLLGMLSSVYDGDESQQPGGQMASARSVGELLRIYKSIARLGMRATDRALTI